MENNNADVLTILNEMNNNIKLVLEELKKGNEQKMKNPPNLFDLFGGMNQQQNDNDDEDEEDEEEEEEDEEEEAEEVEETEEVEKTK